MEREHGKKKPIRRFLHRYLNGSRGVISLFLAILMVPFLSIAGALVNAARINSAVAVFDEALCNSANSTLGTYDAFLKKRFGLLALSQNRGLNIDYTAQDVIQETFQKYMEENVGALSNTYFDVSTTASGIYPLSDPDVLRIQINEYGKLAIPTKIVIDGLSLDDLVKELTKKFEKAQALCDFGTAGIGAISNFSEIDETHEELKEKQAAAQTAKGTVDTEFSALENAVEAYNAAKADYEDAVDTRDSYDGDDQDTKRENQQAISAARTALTSARTELKDARDGYAEALGDYAESMKDLGEAAVAMRNSKEDCVNSLVDTAGNTVNMVTTFKGAIREEEIEEKKAELAKAKNPEPDENGVVTVDATRVAQLESDLNNLEHSHKSKEEQEEQDGKLREAAIEAAEAGFSGQEAFYERNFVEEYTGYVNTILSLKLNVESYSIPQSENEAEDVSDLENTVGVGLTMAEVISLEEDIEKTLVQSSGYAVLKALISFARALFTVSVGHNWVLNSTISDEGFAALPSQRDPSRDALKSEFEEEDAALSQQYKDAYGEYMDESMDLPGETTLEQLIQKVIDHFNVIMDCIDPPEDSTDGFFKRIGTLFIEIADLLADLPKLFVAFLAELGNTVMRKSLLAGYVAYNMPNRTTYTSSALTGASYSESLPITQDTTADCFYGAEAEYVLFGKTSEKTNQEYAFLWTTVIRSVSDIYVVLTSDLVEIVANLAALIPFAGPVLYYFTYVLFIVMEGMLDTIILVNEGTVPIIKSTAYLSVGGLAKLAKQLGKIPISTAAKNEMRTKVVGKLNGLVDKVNDNLDEGEETVEKFNEQDMWRDDMTDEEKQKEKLLEAFNMDYTKNLLLIGMFRGSDGMLKRIGDVIQMESNTYLSTQIAGGTFDLDSSYTYLRVSGRFDAHEFIQLSDSGVMSASERVIYRGY